MLQAPRWPLATKLVIMGFVFLVLALASIGLTLSVTWKLEGGAAAVNEAGRMRMQTYRLALQVHDDPPAALATRIQRFERSLQDLRDGDPSRPLFVPWSGVTTASYAEVQSQWAALRARWETGQAPASLQEVDGFVGAIDHLVSAIEAQLSRWTSILHAFQLAMMALAVGSAVALLYAGYLLVLDPLRRLQGGLKRLEAGDLGTRVSARSSDEFGQLAEGFNRMAQSLQTAYQTLEAKVQEKTLRLQHKTARLQTLYEVSDMIGQASHLEDLAQGFVRRIREIAHASAAALRWSDESNQRYLLLASDCLPEAMVQAERCLQTSQCHCGQPQALARTRVIPIVGATDMSLGHCAQAGYQTIVSVPVKLHHRVLGELDLFYHGEPGLTEEDSALLETLASHLATAMEGLRAQALDKEAAIGEERGLLAQELHDSIAQSLAFLKMQVGMLRSAVQEQDQAAMTRVIGEIDTGVRESYNDVRELLLHFRTRTSAEDIEPALRTTLAKFEHQSGLRTHLLIEGQGLPLPPDVQIQVLHVVQEALSNVRKHACATQVWLTVRQAPTWSFEVRDDGQGFAGAVGAADETHVGLRIMRERAQRIGACVDISTEPGAGTCVTLSLAPRTDGSLPVGTVDDTLAIVEPG